MEWKDLERLPPAAGDDWQARRVGGRLIRGLAAVEAAVAKWHPLDPLMVSPPGSERFLPVLQIAALRLQAHAALRRKHIMSIIVLLAVAVLLVVSGYLAGRESALRAGAMAFAVAAFVTVDYHVVVRRIDALAERAQFALWVCRAGVRHALVWAAVMLVVGGLQLYAEARFGGTEALLLELGAVRERVGDEPWRVMVGPWLHGSGTHWFANFAMLSFAALLAGPLLRAPATAALLIGSSCLSALVSLALEATSPSAVYLGISAGILALLGWCAGAALRRPASFPRGFAVTVAGFALLNVLIAALAVPSASNFGHAAGLGLGVLVGVVLPPADRRTA